MAKKKKTSFTQRHKAWIALFFIFGALAIIFILEGATVSKAFELNFMASGIVAGGAAVGVLVVLLLIAVGALVVPIIGWIIAAVLITAAVILALFLPGDEEPEQSDDQGDGRDVFEDRAQLAVALERDRLEELRQSYCEAGVPEVSGSFLKRPLQTIWEYTYSYTIAACDSSKVFFVRLKGPAGLFKTEFHSITRNTIFSNSKVLNHLQDFDSVCIKVIGEVDSHCFSQPID